MGKTQINFRASDLTREQLDWLQGRWGTSQTETVTVALDRVYQAERAGQDLDGQDGDSWDLQTFLANKWRIDDKGAPLYALLSDAALAVVNLPTPRDRDTAAAHLARGLVALGLGAGLTLDDLRDLGERLQNELIAAIVREAAQAEPAAG